MVGLYTGPLRFLHQVLLIQYIFEKNAKQSWLVTIKMFNKPCTLDTTVVDEPAGRFHPW